MAQLQALLDYYVGQGLVDAATAGQLRNHLDQATAKLAQGNLAAYRSQLQAFVDQVRTRRRRASIRTPRRSWSPRRSSSWLPEAEAAPGFGRAPPRLRRIATRPP